MLPFAKYDYVPSWIHSVVRIGLNDTARALALLDNALRDHEPCLVALIVDPVFDPLRDEIRFSEIARAVGFEL